MAFHVRGQTLSHIRRVRASVTLVLRLYYVEPTVFLQNQLREGLVLALSIITS